MSTWVLLRGLTRESRHWGTFPSLFRPSAEEGPVLALDLPGNGRLYRKHSPVRVAVMVDYCRHKLGRLGYKPPYRLLALSLGAMVAVDWAARYPGELEAAVLINTSLGGFHPWHWRLRPGAWPILLALALAEGDAERRERLVLELTSAREELAGQVLREWSAYRRQYPVSRRNALRQLQAGACYRPPAAKPPVPMLLLAGARDRLVNPRCSEDLAQRWGIPLAMHPEAGHDLPLDDGLWVVRQVRAWLAALPQQGERFPLERPARLPSPGVDSTAPGSA